MKTICWLWCVALLIPSTLVGCKDASSTKTKESAAQGRVSGEAATAKDEEGEIRANLAQLNPEDRKLAEEQKFCVIQEETRLGAMDTPIKVMVKGQPMFVCCKGCVKKALKNPEQTLTKVEELRAKAAGSPKR